MSMSQEEIEALMNGLDIEDDNEPEDIVEPVKVNTKEIEELLSQTEDLKDEIQKADSIASDDNKNKINSEIENLLNEIESTSKVVESNIEDFSFENSPLSKKDSDYEINNSKKSLRSEDDIVKDWTSSKIEEGVFPLPAEKDTKVVNQLSQVANDSEEKVSQIFDVLSLTLDNNNELRNKLKTFESFLSSQVNLLSSLNNKFPNIKVFDEHLNSAKTINSSLVTLKEILNDEDNHIFQAMELMQFNDINRQKIERVMSVIRKLSLYLNNLFEDDGLSKDIAVAKHIHGDDTNDLIGEDLDKLIAEFSHNN